MTFDRLSATLLAAQQLAGDAHRQPALRRARPVRRPLPADPRLLRRPVPTR